jgi:hypothetical protein
MALKMAVFGNPNSTYAAEITFTTCDLCLKNPNAIALPLPEWSLPESNITVLYFSPRWLCGAPASGVPIH